jgi:hypothetical protein
MLKRVLFAAAGLAAMGLAACGGGGNTITNPTPGPTCNPSVTSQLVYPAPGATGVSPTISEIVIAVSSPLPANTYNLSLANTANASNTAQTANFLNSISASQLPAGSATTTIPNPTYEAVGLIASLYTNFNTGTQLQTAINLPSSTCTPMNVPGGTFTLQ